MTSMYPKPISHQARLDSCATRLETSKVHDTVIDIKILELLVYTYNE